MIFGEGIYAIVVLLYLAAVGGSGLVVGVAYAIWALFFNGER